METSQQPTCTVIVNSCDKYESAWRPFFDLLAKYWPSCPYPLVLNTETKSFQHTSVPVQVLHPVGPAPTWGARMRQILEQVPSDYVLLLLEDFFFQSPVNQAEIEHCLTWLEREPEAAAIYFKRITGFQTPYNDDYLKLDERRAYLLNLQAGVWRKEALLDVLKETDSPWSFEEKGHDRLTDEQFNYYTFYCTAKGSHTDSSENIFNYLVARQFGYGIWMGKWLWNNHRLFTEHGVTPPKTLSLEKMSKGQYIQYKIKRRLAYIKEHKRFRP